jgi:ribonucleoside-diphosphate reductase alpha chain
MFLDDTACNLASINLMKMMNDKGAFDVQAFTHVVHIMITAQELLVDSASYPTKAIAERSHKYRTLGLGYANLGAMIMSLGMPYDSDDARQLAASITSLMSAVAYKCSQKLARIFGPFDGYQRNASSMLKVLGDHLECAMDTRDACGKLNAPMARIIADAATSIWTNVLSEGHKGHGFRNGQVTVLAPTGTIGFMMDCDTTGVEPDIALVKYKALAGGGMMKIVNQSVCGALKHLGYSDSDIAQILDYIEENDTIEGCNTVNELNLPVFDCAFKPKNGKRSIHYIAHLKMMAAVQPFLSGAISKTVNMPETVTPDEIAEVYMRGWKMGLKAVAIYRENSKRIQPLSADKDKGEGHELKRLAGKHATDDGIDPTMVIDILAKAIEAPDAYPIVAQALIDYTQATIRQVQAEQREKLPNTRASITHKFEVQGHEGYITIGMYDDGRPGEVFITMNKEGSTVRGLMDGLGVALSMCFQYGVPLSVLADKFEHTRFEPAGFTKNPQIPMAKSLLDYIFRWLSLTFPDGLYIAYTPAEVVGMAAGNIEDIKTAELQVGADPAEPGEDKTGIVVAEFQNQSDAPLCANCGSITVRNGSCYRCHNCGSSLGCS